MPPYKFIFNPISHKNVYISYDASDFEVKQRTGWSSGQVASKVPSKTWLSVLTHFVSKSRLGEHMPHCQICIEKPHSRELLAEVSCIRHEALSWDDQLMAISACKER